MWNQCERNSSSGSCSVQPASGNCEHGPENSGSLSETPASGNRQHMRKVVQNVKNRLGHNESVSKVSMDSEKIHVSIWTLLVASSMQAAMHMDPSDTKTLDILKNSELQNIESLFKITNMMSGENSEIKDVLSSNTPQCDDST